MLALAHHGQAQKAAADKVAEGLKEQLARVEEQLVHARSELADKLHQQAFRHGEEEQALRQRLAEATRASERLQLQHKQAESHAHDAASRIDALSKRVHELTAEKEQAQNEARQSETRARQAQELAARENERLQHNLGNASAQLTVLMDTIQALQGADGERMRVANLTTKLSMAQAVELQLQLCNAQLHHELQDRLWQTSNLESQLSSLQAQLSQATRKASEAQAVQEMQAREVHALKAEVAEREELLSQVAWACLLLASSPPAISCRSRHSQQLPSSLLPGVLLDIGWVARGAWALVRHHDDDDDDPHLGQYANSNTARVERGRTRAVVIGPARVSKGSSPPCAD